MKTALLNNYRGLALALAVTVLAGLPSAGWSQLSTVYSNNFESYTPDSYPIPSNTLPGWTGMTSQNGLQPAIVSPPANTTNGNALNLNSIGGGATGYLSVNSPLLAGSAADWSVSGSARYLASYHTNPWYGTGGILLSSTGDFSGDYLWMAIQSGWGEVDATTTWARPTVEWKLAGTTGGGTLLPWAPPAGVVVTEGNAMRMSTDTWGPAALTGSRTGGASTISYIINTPTDGPFAATLSFSGAQAAALDNLQYVGFANYLSSWQYDNLTVQAVPEPSSMALLGLAGAGLALHVIRRRRR